MRAAIGILLQKVGFRKLGRIKGWIGWVGAVQMLCTVFGTKSSKKIKL